MEDSNETRITQWLSEQRQDMLDLLSDVVDTDSGSYDKAGVDAVGAHFERFLANNEIESWREPHGVFGDAIHAKVGEP
ncbi:M20 family metallopeptidase, partial [Klebsiella oxytoca]|uniref:M20 family metallopeptidase n=1 Tax=Klebsiella oxytoca TaxID=571 RepID=UPI0013D2C8B0